MYGRQCLAANTMSGKRPFRDVENWLRGVSFVILFIWGMAMPARIAHHDRNRCRSMS